jgi:hypothetical protein
MFGNVSQAANALMMVRPVRFCYNAETAVDNAFQKESDTNTESIQAKARQEFDNYVSILKSKGVEVAVFEDTLEPHKPDSIFPNNWISFHEDGTTVLYPMKANNRRVERRPDIVEGIETTYNFNIQNKIDISKEEDAGRILEGTGSIVFDYINRIAYACVSQRTDKSLLDEIASKLGYKVVAFTSVDANGKEIYHTNVMMCVAERYALICAQSITNTQEREAVLKSLTETGHEVVLLSYEQIGSFAGNALQVRGQEGKCVLIISKKGYDSLSEDQKETIQQYDEIVPIPLDTIETNGGGSARCMIADIRLPKKTV